jgi:hypothetical protein
VLREENQYRLLPQQQGLATLCPILPKFSSQKIAQSMKGTALAMQEGFIPILPGAQGQDRV